MLRTLSSTFRIGLAMMFAVLSSGILQVAPVFAAGGNNAGTIKVVDELGGNDIPENQPILTDCDLAVELYNFGNTADETATVNFESMAPTKDAAITVVGNQSFTVPGDGDQSTKGPEGVDDKDGSQEYSLSFEGTPEFNGQVNGYKVKVSVEVTNTVGNPKTKVFWMPASCGETPVEDPGGILVVSVGCKEVTLGSSTILPVDATTTYKIDGEIASAGANQVGGGVHTVELLVNGVVVDTESVDVDADCDTPPVLVRECPVELPVIRATNLDQKGWTLGDGASYVEGGVELSTPGSWQSSTITRTLTGELRDLGSVIDYTPATQYLGLHVKTELGTLVYEHIYGGNWWLDMSDADLAMVAGAPHNGGGQGSPYYGTLDEWVAAFPHLKTTMLTVLYTSPVAASTTLTSVTINCTKYTFDREDVVTPLPTGIADVCGVGNDVVPHEPTDFYTIVSDTKWQQDGNDPVKKVRTIIYQARDGYKFAASDGWTVSQDGKTASYTYHDWATPCADVCKTVPVIHATNLDTNGWTLGTGAVFVDGGMKLQTIGSWNTSTISRDMTGDLSALGNVIDFLPNQDFLGLHVETSAGTLVYEKYYENQNPANAGKWWSWSDFNVSAGMGYPTFDTLENIIRANPGVTLEKLTVLYTNDVKANVTVTSVKIACNEYTFDLEEETPPVTPTDQEDDIFVDGAFTDTQGLADGELPHVLPMTGPEHSLSAAWIALAGVLTYGMLFYVGSRRQHDL